MAGHACLDGRSLAGRLWLEMDDVNAWIAKAEAAQILTLSRVLTS